MKTLKLTLISMSIAFMACISLPGQTIFRNVLVNINGIDYGEGIGIVTGSYIYHYSFKLSDNGTLESMHWNGTDSHLFNEKGEKVLIIDSGHDSQGTMWYVWNNINFLNTGWAIQYAVDDGWLDEMMPSVMPIEGTFANMSTKVMCKGKIIFMGALLQLHMNANGNITAEVKKGWVE